MQRHTDYAVPSLTAEAQNLRKRLLIEFFGSDTNIPVTRDACVKINEINDKARVWDCVKNAKLITAHEITTEIFNRECKHNTTEYRRVVKCLNGLIGSGDMARARRGRDNVYFIPGCLV